MNCEERPLLITNWKRIKTGLRFLVGEPSFEDKIGHLTLIAKAEVKGMTVLGPSKAALFMKCTTTLLGVTENVPEEKLEKLLNERGFVMVSSEQFSEVRNAIDFGGLDVGNYADQYEIFGFIKIGGRILVAKLSRTRNNWKEEVNPFNELSDITVDRSSRFVVPNLAW